MMYKGYRVSVQRGGAVVVEGATADGQPPKGCRKATGCKYIGQVQRTMYGRWRADNGTRVCEEAPFRSWAVMKLVDLALAAGALVELNPLTEAPST